MLIFSLSHLAIHNEEEVLVLPLSKDQPSRQPIRSGFHDIGLQSRKAKFPLEQRNPKAFVSYIYLPDILIYLSFAAILHLVCV